MHVLIVTYTYQGEAFHVASLRDWSSSVGQQIALITDR